MRRVAFEKMVGGKGYSGGHRRRIGSYTPVERVRHQGRILARHSTAIRRKTVPTGRGASADLHVRGTGMTRRSREWQCDTRWFVATVTRTVSNNARTGGASCLRACSLGRHDRHRQDAFLPMAVSTAKVYGSSDFLAFLCLLPYPNFMSILCMTLLFALIFFISPRKSFC